MTLAPSRLPTSVTTVLLAFRTGESVSAAELRARLTSMNPGSVRSAVGLLLAERLVQRVRYGVYRLTEGGRNRQGAERAAQGGLHGSSER